MNRVFLKLILLLLCFHPLYTRAQAHERWADIVKWDGVTNWRNYLIYAPGYLGPNALPVPDMSNGTADTLNNISVHFAFHSGTGDKTKNWRMRATYCFLKSKMSADISWIPVEFFEVSPQIKDKRHVYYTGYNDTKAKGDVHVNLTLQILNRWRKDVHLAVRAGFRYASSSSVDAARFTDAPGYHFDLSAAKPLFNDRFKLIAMAGIYIWQLNTEGQNDAILYGGGCEYNYRNWRFMAACRGYSGYRHNGDQPMVISSSLEKQFERISIILNLQEGLRDYDFTSVETGIRYNFK